jgi:mRNA interferase MazF
MPSTTTYDRGHVVVVEVPFSDLSGTKRRPAVVVSVEKFHRALPDLIVCPISSQARFYRRPGPGDCPLADWRLVGLRHPSTVRISKLLAVDKQIVKKALGILPSADLARVEASLRHAFGFDDGTSRRAIKRISPPVASKIEK